VGGDGRRWAVVGGGARRATATKMGVTTVVHDGGARRWRTTVAHDGGARRWRTTVAHDGGARRWRATVGTTSVGGWQWAAAGGGGGRWVAAVRVVRARPAHGI